MKNKKYLITIISLVVAIGILSVFAVIRSSKNTEQGEVPIEEINAEDLRRQELEAEAVILKNKNPLLNELPFFSENFEVHYGVKSWDDYSVFYKVILLPQSNPENTEIYVAEIANLRDAALVWINSKNVDPNTLDIEWTTR